MAPREGLCYEVKMVFALSSVARLRGRFILPLFRRLGLCECVDSYMDKKSVTKV